MYNALKLIRVQVVAIYTHQEVGLCLKKESLQSEKVQIHLFGLELPFIPSGVSLTGKEKTASLPVMRDSERIQYSTSSSMKFFSTPKK